jgi:hypothetical protein
LEQAKVWWLTLSDLEIRADDWSLLRIFENRVRLEITLFLIRFEYRSLSEIADNLRERGWKFTLSGVLKHMKELEKIGIVRHEAGIFAHKPDARKTLYFLEGQERVKNVIQHLSNDVVTPLKAGITFSQAADIARNIQGLRFGEEEKGQLKLLLDECRSESVWRHLTDDEKKKIRLWTMMLPII